MSPGTELKRKANNYFLKTRLFLNKNKSQVSILEEIKF